MKRELLRHLVCLSCQSQLELDVTQAADNGEIIEGWLKCPRCQALYPIRRGVPRFIPLQLEEAAAETAKGFSFEWRAFSDVATGPHMGSRQLFLDFIQPVTVDYFGGKTVLDAGCGSGRFCKCAAEFGARKVIGLDLGDSVDVAYENMRSFPNVHIIQADILQMPLKQEYDYIFSIGVLHHTVDPRKSFRALAQLLSPGGGMSVWVYSRENNEWIIRAVNPIRTHLTSRLPHQALNVLSFPLVALLYLVTKGVYRPVNEKPGLRWACRWLPYNGYLHFVSQFGFAEQRNIVFDHLAPRLAFYISRDEFETWFLENGLCDVTISKRAGNSWRGFGVREP